MPTYEIPDDDDDAIVDVTIKGTSYRIPRFSYLSLEQVEELEKIMPDPNEVDARNVREIMAVIQPEFGAVSGKIGVKYLLDIFALLQEDAIGPGESSASTDS